MKTKMFVMTHKKFDAPTDALYVPLHVGRALGNDLGYLGDDTGDNISELNPYYGELTGLYWLWKNYHDTDIVGICHYRRFFVDEKRELMTKEQLEKALEDVDVITSNAVTIEMPYKEYYGGAHNIADLMATGEVIKELYPQDYPAFCQMIEGKRHYYGNLCVMRKVQFDAYCEWLFSIFSVLEKRVDLSSYDAYHKRLYGFLSEGLLMVYILARGLKVSEGRIAMTAEKAETVEFKLAMGQLVKIGQFSEARYMFYEYLKLRPDVQLELSDIFREIPDIELILFILEKEQESGQVGFYQVSKDLKELIKHLRTVRAIIAKEAAGEMIEDVERQYLVEKNVTDLAKEVIRINL